MRGAPKPKRSKFVTLTLVPIAILALAFAMANLAGRAPGTERESGSAGGTGGYVLAFGEDFNPLLASRDDLGISIVIAVDVSGSMAYAPASGGAQKYRQAAEALLEVERVVERLVASAPPGQVMKVGVISFHEALKPLMPLRVLNAQGLGSLRALAGDPANFKPEGKTAIGRAIERGTEWLAQSGTIMRSLVIITDGENTAGPLPEDVLGAVYANRNSASTEDYRVSTSSTLISFIGFDIGSEYFQRFATLGARVASAADRDELAAVLSSILEADITRLEAPAFGGGTP